MRAAVAFVLGCIAIFCFFMSGRSVGYYRGWSDGAINAMDSLCPRAAK